MKPRIISSQILDELTSQAQSCKRLRMNYNYHASLDDLCQRMLNAMEPGTDVPVHRHDVDETFVLLRGAIKVLFYNDDATLAEEVLLNPSEGMIGIEIPAQAWHTVEILEAGTVIFETRQGPYIPRTKDSIMEIKK